MIIKLLVCSAALFIAHRALQVTYFAHPSTSGRTPVQYGLFGYSYVLLALGALVSAAEYCGKAGALEGVGIPAFLLGSVGLIVTNRRRADECVPGEACSLFARVKQWLRLRS